MYQFASVSVFVTNLFQLDLALATWSSTVKSIRDGYKLEEIEIKFKDETKRIIWKVNRPKPENIETVDYVCFSSSGTNTPEVILSRAKWLTHNATPGQVDSNGKLNLK